MRWSILVTLPLCALLVGCGTAPIDSARTPSEPPKEASVQLSAVSPPELAAKMESYHGKVLLLDVWATW